MKKTLIMTRGLPASGKDYWCREIMEKHFGIYKRVNKDDLRNLLDLGKWSRINEKFILKTRDNLIELALKEGFSVICTDTNLAEKHQIKLKEIADKYEAKFEIQDFTNVSLDECIKRDQNRSNYVGEKVIRGMFNQFLKPKQETVVYDPKLPDVIISDIDGTLALFGNANPYDRNFLNDELNIPVAQVIQNLEENYKTIFFSGRNDKYRKDTVTWLRKKLGWLKKDIEDNLFMRHEGDKRKDTIVKKELYEQNVKGKFNILFVLDDRNQVVELWRNLGLPCLQVAEGDF